MLCDHGCRLLGPFLGYFLFLELPSFLLISSFSSASLAPLPLTEDLTEDPTCPVLEAGAAGAHTGAHAGAHPQAHTYAQVCTHRCKHPVAHTGAHAQVHTGAQAHTGAHTRAHTRTVAHGSTCTNAHRCTRTHRSTRTSVHTHAPAGPATTRLEGSPSGWRDGRRGPAPGKSKRVSGCWVNWLWRFANSNQRRVACFYRPQR